MLAALRGLLLKTPQRLRITTQLTYWLPDIRNSLGLVRRFCNWIATANT